jgi:RHS repeat-associated protein
VDSGGTKTFKRDGVGVTAPVLSDGVSSFTPGISARTSGATKFLHDDRLGTLGLETDSSQATTATKTYDAFGMPISSTGSSASPFGFAGGYGYQEDSDSGLKLLGHRYYDPSTGRFLTRDPIKDGRNWYGYCGNNPLRWVDPLGLRKLDEEEKKILIAEKRRLYEQGFEDEALELERMIKNDEIEVFEDEDLDGLTKEQKIYINHKLLHSGRWYQIGSTMLHELGHRRDNREFQGNAVMMWIQRFLNGIPGEKACLRDELKYLKKLRQDKRYKKWWDEIDGLIEELEGRL